VPKAPEPMIVPRRSSDSLMSRNIAMSGFASLGVRGCSLRHRQHTHWWCAMEVYRHYTPTFI